jgi:putative transposase
MVAPVLERYGDFAVFLDQQEDIAEAFRALLQSETTGRPLGTDLWIEKLTAETSKAWPQKERKKAKREIGLFSNLSR